jgi:hypothetical protein
MSDPISTLFQLNDLSEQLDMTQAWINSARMHHPTNGEVQLELDRKQTEVDAKREAIARLMFDIPRRN